MKKIVLIFNITLLIISCTSRNNFYRISEDEYVSKMKAAWIGQMAGVGWGAPTEFKSNGKILTLSKMPPWEPEKINQFGQDDMYVEMTFLSSLEKYGIGVNIREAGIDFANTGYFLWAANNRGRENLREGIAPPESGHPAVNKNADDIDYQIEADYSGIIAPGMPQVAVDLGEKFGRLMNYGDGVYAGQFMGGMYATAFFEENLEKIVEGGLSCIPPSSQYAECIRDVLQWYRENPENWQTTWQRIEDTYYNNPDYQRLANRYDEAWPDINAKINGAYVVTGLLYGNGNPDSTIVIATRCGRDSDCNPSSAAGVLFTTLGFEQLPPKYTEALQMSNKFRYTRYDFTGLMAVCLKLARENVIASGGRIVSESGETWYEIPVRKPVPSALKQSWDPGYFEMGNRYTQEEMDRIIVYPVAAFDSTMQDFSPDWRVYFCGKETIPGLSSIEGKEKVLITAPMETERGVNINLNNDRAGPLGEQNRLFVEAGAEKGSPWKLSVRVDWKILKEEVIGDEDTFWEKISVDLSDFKGENPPVQLLVENIDGKMAKNYWAAIAIRR